MLQQIKDEILTGDPRYIIQDDAGHVIEEDVQITLTTPVQQEGTPLNKTTLENIQGDLYTQDRYNTPTYSGSAMTLALPLTSYEVGKIVNIIAPASITNPTLNINKLGAKTINGSVRANVKYVLIYNGTSFDIFHSQIATIEEAMAGTSNDLLMTPLTVKAAMGTQVLYENYEVISGEKCAVSRTITGLDLTDGVYLLSFRASASAVASRKGYLYVKINGTTILQLYDTEEHDTIDVTSRCFINVNGDEVSIISLNKHVGFGSPTITAVKGGTYEISTRDTLSIESEGYYNSDYDPDTVYIRETVLIRLA